MLGVVLVHACGEAEGIVGGLTTLLAVATLLAVNSQRMCDSIRSCG